MEATNKNDNLRGTLALTLCAIIWGSSFVAQSVGMDYIGPFTFQCIRSALGFGVLGIFLLVQIFTGKRPVININSFMIRGGLTCGLLLAVASWLQNAAMETISAGKGGFITAFYLILVPIYSIFLKKRVPLKTWFCAILAFVGLYFLSIADTGFGNVGNGDILCFLCAFFFAAHILAVDYYLTEMDGVLLSFLQFGVSAIVSYLPMFLIDKPTRFAIANAGPSLLYSGIVTCGLAYTLQLIGQKYVQPTVATILMSMESVFSLITGMIILHEMPTVNGWIGCAVMFAAVILCELPPYVLWDRMIAGGMNRLAGRLPQTLTDEQFQKNAKLWKRLKREVTDEKGYIEYQKKLYDMDYGRSGKLGKKLFFHGAELTAADNACEVIAVYNAFHALDYDVELPALIKRFSENGIAFSGKFGTAPKAVRECLESQGLAVRSLTGSRITEKAVTELGQACDTFILMAYNKGHNPFSMIHTMSITREKTAEGEIYFSLHNSSDEISHYENLYACVKGYNAEASAPLIFMAISKR